MVAWPQVEVFIPELDDEEEGGYIIPMISLTKAVTDLYGCPHFGCKPTAA